MELTFTNNVLEKLQALADNAGVSVVDYCTDVIIDHAMLNYYEDMNELYKESFSHDKIEKKDANNVKPVYQDKEEMKSVDEEVVHTKRKLK